MRLTVFVFAYVMVFLLSACGGGSSNEAPAPPVTPVTGNLATVSGVVRAAANRIADSDLNDPNAEFVSNTEFTTAQEVENLVTIQGFATAVPTSEFATGFDNRSDDRFFNTNDLDDYYRVSLQAGQVIRVQVVDYDQFDTDSPFAGDLDLYLFDEQFNIISSSLSETEFEELIVPVSGDYFVNVYAFSGASKYVLNLNSGPVSETLARQAQVVSSADFVPHEAIVKLTATGLPVARSSAASYSLQHSETSRATLARFKESDVFSTSVAANDAAMQELAQLNPQGYAKVMTLRRIKALRQLPGVELAEPNYRRYPQRIPDDEYYPLQWHYPVMNLPQAWDISTGTPASGKVIVAVIDTGVVLSHPELNGQLVSGYDFIADDQNSQDGEPGIDDNPDDPGDGVTLGSSSWHGTHVAGTVAAASDNGAGITGVSWGANVMPLRALGSSGGSSYDVMQALRFAAGLSNDSGTLPARRADIVNLSFGGAGSSAAEADLYKRVYDLGVILVAAAGNENTSRLSYPASYEGVISVSALDLVGNRAPYSNFGAAIDIAAPGGNVAADRNNDGQPDGILSILADDSSGIRQPTVAFYQGTSMATPHVAGMLALMKAVYPGLDAASVDSLLQSGALTDDDGNPGWDNIYGFGSANALKAVQVAQVLASGGDPPALPASVVAVPASLAIGSGGSAALTISNQGGGEPSLTSIADAELWLSVAPVQTGSDGLGDYLVSVNGEGLSDGLYLGTIRFDFDGASSLEVRVSMTVGEVETGGDLAEIYILLYDSDTETSVAQVSGMPDNSGNINYSVNSVPPGKYIIYAGTDIDNDGFICQSAEGCGTYPSLGEPVPVEVNGVNISDLNFISDILAGFGNLESLVEMTDKKAVGQGVPALKVTKKTVPGKNR